MAALIFNLFPRMIDLSPPPFYWESLESQESCHVLIWKEMNINKSINFTEVAFEKWRPRGFSKSAADGFPFWNKWSESFCFCFSFVSFFLFARRHWITTGENSAENLPIRFERQNVNLRKRHWTNGGRSMPSNRRCKCQYHSRLYDFVVWFFRFFDKRALHGK